MQIPEELKKAEFKKISKRFNCNFSFSQPDNRYSNIQIARLPRFVPSKTACNKPMPKAQNLYYYMERRPILQLTEYMDC